MSYWELLGLEDVATQYVAMEGFIVKPRVVLRTNASYAFQPIPACPQSIIIALGAVLRSAHYAYTLVPFS